MYSYRSELKGPASEMVQLRAVCSLCLERGVCVKTEEASYGNWPGACAY